MRSSSEHEASPSSSSTPPPKSESRLRRAAGRWADTRWGGAATALAAILAGAAALRVVGIQYGLPFGNLLNPDEASIVPRAWKLVHGGGGDPHWFDYPTLLMYVNAPFQAWQSEPSFLTARIVGVVLSLGAIAAAWWLGQRAYGTGVVAAAAVAVCTIEVAYSRAAVTDVPRVVPCLMRVHEDERARREECDDREQDADGKPVPALPAGDDQWDEQEDAWVLEAGGESDRDAR